MPIRTDYRDDYCCSRLTSPKIFRVLSHILRVLSLCLLVKSRKLLKRVGQSTHGSRGWATLSWSLYSTDRSIRMITILSFSALAMPLLLTEKLRSSKYGTSRSAVGEPSFKPNLDLFKGMANRSYNRNRRLHTYTIAVSARPDISKPTQQDSNRRTWWTPDTRSTPDINSKLNNGLSSLIIYCPHIQRGRLLERDRRSLRHTHTVKFQRFAASDP